MTSEDLSDRDRELIAGIAARLNAENRAAADNALLRREEARYEAGRIAEELAKADPQLRRVILFGSLLDGRRFRENSDIDLAVEGGTFSTLLGIAEKSAFDVDIVCIEDMAASFRDLALAEGVTLYKRDTRRS